ncbi:uncharacterized protein ACLA_059030 [Aspergillus clavatus NRRL 1]|uniref:Hydrophobin n=1 Tax=Aspergillus clavatus (strain ATCC 1007 / CBS 513.65 / DSM 816 / NCTC 3887 / NRRL 1 / QM 1276 / 107) TaxID=344612 RepID=A1C4A0_ASPCL|nr:uncharacterized protein ACLA_059030 [Aspergillus clavatus NRRL 1]EAW15240.1 hypothetical protein ACLA_059030 [Aspergillus clavatus NRRL 1]
MRLLSLSLLAAVAAAIPAAEKACSGVGFPCGNATVTAYDCCVPLVCVPGVIIHRGEILMGAQRPVCQVPPRRLH